VYAGVALYSLFRPSTNTFVPSADQFLMMNWDMDALIDTDAKDNVPDQVAAVEAAPGHIKFVYDENDELIGTKLVRKEDRDAEEPLEPDVARMEFDAHSRTTGFLPKGALDQQPANIEVSRATGFLPKGTLDVNRKAPGYKHF